MLRYGGDTNCTTVPGGFVTAAGKLCSVTTPDGRVTQLFYDASARLARIVGPGGVTTDYGYNTANQIETIREPLAFDAVSAGVRADGAGVRWTIGYSGDKATTVTPPQATPADTAQPVTINYVAAATAGALGETRLSVAGADQPLGWSRKVTFDHLFRTRVVTDITGATVSTTYDGTSDRTSFVDTVRPNGVAMRSSTIYDTSVVFNGLSRPIGSLRPGAGDAVPTEQPAPRTRQPGAGAGDDDRLRRWHQRVGGGVVGRQYGGRSEPETDLCRSPQSARPRVGSSELVVGCGVAGGERSRRSFLRSSHRPDPPAVDGVMAFRRVR